jgi:adenylyl-sulfate kinase
MTQHDRSGFTLWLTGLPCAGKSSIASRVAPLIRERGLPAEVLDGDEVRRYLGQGLGFSKEDRDTNIRRIGYVCRLLTRNGVAAIVAAVSPYRAVRDEVRSEIGRFVEVHVRCPLEVVERRDVKGMYAKARKGEISHFTGISDPYEEPLEPELVLRTDQETVDESVARVMATLDELGYLAGGSRKSGTAAG